MRSDSGRTRTNSPSTTIFKSDVLEGPAQAGPFFVAAQFACHPEQTSLVRRETALSGVEGDLSAPIRAGARKARILAVGKLHHIRQDFDGKRELLPG